MISRRLTGLESLRANNIAHTIAREQNRARELLLRIARHITADHGQTHAEAQPLEEAQPQRDQPAPLVVRGQADQHGRADDADGVGRAHGQAADVVVAGADDAAEDERQKLDGAAGDLQVLRAEGGEAEGADDDGCELLVGGQSIA